MENTSCKDCRCFHECRPFADVSAHDPLTLVCVALSLLAAGLLASLVPAIRAAGVDPVTSLRAE